MKFTLIIPHYGTGKMTAYSVAQFLKYKGKHELDIVVVDNKPDGSIDYLNPFLEEITVFNYPQDKLQSHGIAYDYVLSMGIVATDYFLTAESDSYPTSELYFDHIEQLINDGYDAGGSLLTLSGGQYMHGCGAFYRTKIWHEANEYCNSIPYHYFPNLSVKEGFDCHTMIHHSILADFLNAPEDYVELAQGYKGLNMVQMMDRCSYYSPVRGPMHNGMGGKQESVKTYGMRSVEDDSPHIILDGKQKIIKRIGYEPSQWMSYFMAATNKKVCYMPTWTTWIDGKEGQQQEFTKLANGFTHLWGISAYKNVDPNDEIAKIKQALPEHLYEILPEHQKIKA